MTIIDSRHPHIGPRWDINPFVELTEAQQAAIDGQDQKQNFDNIHKSTLTSAEAPLPPVQLSRSAKVKGHNIRDTQATASKSDIVAVKPSIGTPILTTPQEVASPLPKKAVAEEFSVQKTASTEGFLNGIKNFFSGLFGWGAAPADTSAETHLVGSPKEVIYSPRDVEMMSKALEQMSKAIDELITKASDQAKENNSEQSDKEAEIILLKQMLNEMQILRRIIASIKGEVGSKELEAMLATDEVTKNYEENKVIQGKYLENAKEIELHVNNAMRLQILKSLASGTAVGTFVFSAVLAMSGIPIPMVFSFMSGVAAIVQAGSTAIKAHVDGITDNKIALSVGFKDLIRQLQDHFKSRTQETIDSYSRTVALQKFLITLSQNQKQMIQYASQLINR